jgi:hypothetical protein
MSTSFPKSDLAALASLPSPLRALALLSALRFVEEGDLRETGVTDADLQMIVRRRLAFRFPLQRKLTDAETTDVFAVSRRGAIELARALSLDASTVPSSTQKSCTRTPMFLDHTLGVSTFALALARGLTSLGAPGALLSWESDAERLADAVHVMTEKGFIDRQPLVADGLAVVLGPRGPEGLLVEVDRNSERPSYLGRKFRGYLEWWQKGGHERRFDVKAIRLLTVAPDAKRAERLREACREAMGGKQSGLFAFAAEDSLVKDGILAPVWSTLRSENVSLWS